MTQQLTLPLRLRDFASFANFYAGDNCHTFSEISALAKQQHRGVQLCLYGPGGSGKSHLLHALCRQSAALEVPVAYLSLDDTNLSPDVLEDLDGRQLVCLDSIDSVVGQHNWEMPLFMLIEMLRQNRANLLVAMQQQPSELEFSMPEVRSRILNMLVLPLKPLDEAGKRLALMQRARLRGFELPEEVVEYILKRFTRDSRSLFRLLDRIDAESLSAQRRVTIPFVRDMIRQ